MARNASSTETGSLSSDTLRIISRERGRQAKHRPSLAAMHWRLAASKVLHKTRAGVHYADHIGVTEREHMSDVDCFDGASMRGAGSKSESRQTKGAAEADEAESDLLTIHPEVDGRLKDEGRS